MVLHVLYEVFHRQLHECVWSMGIKARIKKCTSMCLQFGTSSDGKEVTKELQLYK